MDDYTRSRFIQAVNKFNSKDFFDCHEILEDIWFDVKDDSRDFYQGLLHLAVAFYHLTKKNNTKGMTIQLKKGLLKLEHYDVNFNGIDLGRLRTQILNINKNLAKDKPPVRLPKITFL
jgi:predicted metal-dependent hydrolase